MDREVYVITLTVLLLHFNSYIKLYLSSQVSIHNSDDVILNNVQWVSLSLLMHQPIRCVVRHYLNTFGNVMYCKYPHHTKFRVYRWSAVYLTYNTIKQHPYLLFAQTARVAIDRANCTVCGLGANQWLAAVKCTG